MLNALAPVLPGLIGGSADLAPSNLTLMKMFGDFQKGSYAERNLRCVLGATLHPGGMVCCRGDSVLLGLTTASYPAFVRELFVAHAARLARCLLPLPCRVSPHRATPCRAHLSSAASLCHAAAIRCLLRTVQLWRA
jgi:hypothetical protein